MIFRLSQKLATKIKAGPLTTLPPQENPFADWSAHLFVVDRRQYVLLCNTKSLYSAVMVGKGITDDGRFIERALSNIREFMEADGQAFVYHHFIVPATASVRFAKALDRSVTGSMNDLIRQATFFLGNRSPFQEQPGARLAGAMSDESRMQEIQRTPALQTPCLHDGQDALHEPATGLAPTPETPFAPQDRPPH